MENRYFVILSRDCRSDDTKTWYAKVRKSPFYGYEGLTLYKKGKKKMHFNRLLPMDILDTFIFRMGTSTYELVGVEDVEF